MAQARRKRRTKHRGTAAGTIEARGRTGKPPTKEERKRQTRTQARNRRQARPPSWRSATTRAALAGVIIFVFILITGSLFTPKGHKTGTSVGSAAGFALIAMGLYIPMGYFLDRAMYRRFQRRAAAAKGEGRR
jgi:threonine/homoserine/homoserine lactone efflux protein